MYKPSTSVNPRLPARHNWLAEAFIYRLLIKRPTRAQFDRVWFRMVGPQPTPRDGPLICYLSHPSWWDGYMAMLLHRLVFKRQFENYLMMDERQLARYRFFTYVGVSSVSLTNAREAARSVDYIARLLRERRDRCLWIFPQGDITPGDQRPITIHSGIARIIRKAGGATLCPVALRFEFRGEQHPEAFIRAGAYHHVAATASNDSIIADIQQRLTNAMDALRDEVMANHLEDYRVLLYGRQGVNRRFDALLRLLPRQNDSSAPRR